MVGPRISLNKILSTCNDRMYSSDNFTGAVLFVRPMRKAEYVTMLDPFQERYGAGVGGLLFIPALFGDLFWCGTVLKALGSSLVVIADVDPHLSICASALLAAMLVQKSMLQGMHSRM